MNKSLQQFYNDYAAWLDKGAPQFEPFCREAGLCHNLGKFGGGDRDAYIEMTRQFEAAGLDYRYPFNDGDDDYIAHIGQADHYLNPLRIKWVRDHAIKPLQQFYNDYAAWLDAGAPEDDKQFTRGEGLCSQAMKRPYRVPLNEIKKQFAEAGLDSLYPFGGVPQFDIDLENRAMHLNPERVKWVKDHANNQ